MRHTFNAYSQHTKTTREVAVEERSFSISLMSAAAAAAHCGHAVSCVCGVPFI